MGYGKSIPQEGTHINGFFIILPQHEYDGEGQFDRNGDCSDDYLNSVIEKDRIREGVIFEAPNGRRHRETLDTSFR